MTVSVPRHPGPWTIDDLYAIPDDGYRYEIADGSLLVSPRRRRWNRYQPANDLLHTRCPGRA